MEKCMLGLLWLREFEGPCRMGGGNMVMCMHQQWYSVCVDTLAKRGRGCMRAKSCGVRLCG